MEGSIVVFLNSGLTHRTGADVSHHGADDHEDGDRDRGPHAGPESDAAEGDEESALGECEGEAELIGQQGAHRDSKQEASGPDKRDAKRELHGLRNHLGSSFAPAKTEERSTGIQLSQPNLNFTEKGLDGTITERHADVAQ